MTPFIMVLGYLLGIGMIFVAATCWRKAQNFHSLLVESAHRIDSLKSELQSVDRDRSRAVEKLDQAKEQLQRLEKQLLTAQTKLSTDLKALEERALTAEEQKAHFELRTDHYRSQSEALTRQLKESDLALRDAQTKLAYAQNREQEQLAKLRQELQREHQDLKQKLQSSEKHAQEFVKRQAASVDLETVKILARKATHFESLYRAMRGQREMAEERNRNWEVALRKLSSYVVQAKPSASGVEADKLGPLVGAALETIGAQLIDDEYSKTP